MTLESLRTTALAYLRATAGWKARGKFAGIIILSSWDSKKSFYKSSTRVFLTRNNSQFDPLVDIGAAVRRRAEMNLLTWFILNSWSTKKSV